MSGLIVVGLDGSDSSIEALRWAAAQARLAGSTLDVVSAWHYPASLGWSTPWPSEFNPEADAQKALSEIVSRELGGERDLAVRETVVEGHPAEVLLDEAKRADLLVVGSRGHGAFAGMLLGSVSQHCVAHAECPVVVVPPRNE